MSNYGIQPTGYVRKPLSVILADLEAAMVTEFGPGVIQTPQSPLGQLNGLMADLLAEVDERNLDLYQSYDPDQAEAVRLDTLARIRLIGRGLQTDDQYRRAITNAGQGRIDIQDLARALSGLPGVSYSRVFVNDSGEVENPELQRGFVSVAVIGGDDEDVAETVRRFIVPGISTYGNTVVTSARDGYCRSLSIIRPIPIEVNIELKIRVTRDMNNCPPPATSAVAATLESAWEAMRENGKDVTYFNVRSLIESVHSNVEVVSFTASRPGFNGGPGQTVPIGFTEIASLNVTQVDIVA